MGAGDDARIRRFEELFTEHFTAVLAYALARADLDTAKDAAADTFLVAWRRLDDVPDRPRPWLLAVTRKTLATQRRALMRQDVLARRVGARSRPESSGTEGSARWVESEAVRGALNRLSEVDRELLCLLAWDGMTPGEAAEVLAVSAATFRVRYFRARKRFEASFAKERATDTPAQPRLLLLDDDTQENLA